MSEDPPRLIADDAAPRALRDALGNAATEVDGATRARLASAIGVPGAPGIARNFPSRLWWIGGAVVAASLVWFAWPKKPAEIPVHVTPIANVEPPPIVTQAPEPAISQAPMPIPEPSHSVRAVLPDEATLFKQARDALHAGDPQRTLDLTAELAKRFPNGTFTQERDVLRIDALVALGRTDEAKKAARLFISQHPESAHRPRLESMLSSP